MDYDIHIEKSARIVNACSYMLISDYITRRKVDANYIALEMHGLLDIKFMADNAMERLWNVSLIS